MVDAVGSVAQQLADTVGAEAGTDWRAAVKRPDIDVVVVATPNGVLAEIACAALEAGKHVLVEKPMGRNLSEAEAMRIAAERAGCVLKVGFNHRYHPAIAEAHRRVGAGVIGEVINIRARYGHGGRPGYEREWRGDRLMAGGGELTDQGVHVADLLHWFVGEPSSVFALLQTAVWPLGDLEDNAFALLQYEGGVVASVHTSWTQWKNLFSFEIFGTLGAMIVEGLGRSYGVETLTQHVRSPAGGAPATEELRFDGEDRSWTDEWRDLLNAIVHGTTPLGSAPEGVAVMRTLDALYRSAQCGMPVVCSAEMSVSN